MHAMKTLFMISLSLLYAYGTIVLNVPNEKEDTFLSFDKNIEVGIPITVCIRFKLKGYLTNRVIFSSKGDTFRLSLQPQEGQGWIRLNTVYVLFKITRDNFQPYLWHHLCYTLDKESFMVIIDGKQVYQNKYSNTTLNQIASTNMFLKRTKIQQIRLGSLVPNEIAFSHYENFKGELTELNIWNKALSKAEMMELTKTCEITNPAPDILNWSEDVTLYLSGVEDMSKVDLAQLCDQTVERRRIVQVLLNQDDAIHTCNVLNGKLAYPSTIDEYNTWKSK